LSETTKKEKFKSKHFDENIEEISVNGIFAKCDIIE